MPLELKASIPASPELIFSVLSDPRRAPEWMPSIQRIEGLSDAPFGVGTSWRETRRAGKRTMESTIRVVACEPGQRLALTVESKPMVGDLQFTLKPSGLGTDVHYRAEMKGRGLMRLMTGTINRMMANEDANLLARLERQVAKAR